MAQCKYCHARITRIDKEVCPFCGGKRPLDGTDTSTQDVTKIIDQLENPVEIKHKKRVVAAILALLFGFLGAPHIYLGKIKKGLVMALISVCFIGAVGLILFFAVKWHSVFAFLIPYFVVEAYCCYCAFVYLTKHNIQDCHGEFLE